MGAWHRPQIPRFSETDADDFVIGDLRDQNFVKHMVDRRFDEIYQLAADMGGAGYIFTGEHDADVMHLNAKSRWRPMEERSRSGVTESRHVRFCI